MRLFFEMINQNMPVLKTLIAVLSLFVIALSVGAIKNGNHKVNDGVE
jgi:hypothetical protein